MHTALRRAMPVLAIARNLAGHMGQAKAPVIASCGRDTRHSPGTCSQEGSGVGCHSGPETSGPFDFDVMVVPHHVPTHSSRCAAGQVEGGVRAGFKTREEAAREPETS